MPIAYVASIHFLGAKRKLFKPASFLKVSNLTPLKSGYGYNPKIKAIIHLDKHSKQTYYYTSFRRHICGKNLIVQLLKT